MAKRNDEARPGIEGIGDSAELRRWYWLKSELVAHARTVGVKTTGGKFTILDRLAHYLDTGETQWPGDLNQKKPTSKFDWHKQPLTPETVITDSYKNSQNVRRFFKSQLGDDFKFSIAFMEWIKANVGKTLGDAVAEHRRLQQAVSDPNHQTKIKPHNQFNQYTRDFLADNPEMGLDDVRKFWRLKRNRPTKDGRHVYDPSDLLLTDSASG